MIQAIQNRGEATIMHITNSHVALAERDSLDLRLGPSIQSLAWVLTNLNADIIVRVVAGTQVPFSGQGLFHGPVNTACSSHKKAVTGWGHGLLG